MSLDVWLILGLTKTIPQESFQIDVKVLQDSHHEMLIFLIRIVIHLSSISSDKQKVLQKYTTC